MQYLPQRAPCAAVYRYCRRAGTCFPNPGIFYMDFSMPGISDRHRSCAADGLDSFSCICSAHRIYEYILVHVLDCSRNWMQQRAAVVYNLVRSTKGLHSIQFVINNNNPNGCKSKSGLVVASSQCGHSLTPAYTTLVIGPATQPQQPLARLVISLAGGFMSGAAKQEQLISTASFRLLGVP